MKGKEKDNPATETKEENIVSVSRAVEKEQKKPKEKVELYEIRISDRCAIPGLVVRESIPGKGRIELVKGKSSPIEMELSRSDYYRLKKNPDLKITRKTKGGGR